MSAPDPELTPVVEEVGSFAWDGLPFMAGGSLWPVRPEGDEWYSVFADTGGGKERWAGLTTARFGPRGRSVL